MRNLAAAFLEIAQDRPDSIAFITPQNALTFRLISQLAKIAQDRLLARGLRKASRICVYVTRAEWNTIVPLALSGTDLSICFGNPTDIEAAGLKIDLVITDIHEYAIQNTAKTLLIDAAWFSNLEAPLIPATGSGFIIAFSSSGSTGQPKYIERGEEEFCNTVSLKLNTFKRARHPRLLVTHGEAGMWCLSERLAVLLSGHVNILSGRDFESTLHSIDRNAVNVLATTPSFLNNLLATKFQKNLLQTLEEIFVGGAIVSPELLRRLNELTTARVIISYGSIEMSRNATKDIVNFDFIDGCVGTPLANCEIQIFNESGNPVGEEIQGEVAVRNAMVLKKMQYVNDIPGSNSQFRNGWFFPGDLGYFKNGELYISGRSNEVINVGGNKIAPELVEAVLLRSNLVKTVCAIAIKGTLGVDELHVAYVAERTIDAGILTKVLRDSGYTFAINKAMRCLSLPMTDAGKVDKVELKNLMKKQ